MGTRLWLLAALLSVPCLAAEPANTSNILWLYYAGDHAVSKRWGAHFETHYRFDVPDDESSLFLVRPGVNFRASKHVALTVGYAYLRSLHSQAGGTKTVGTEHRAYEEARIRHRASKLTIRHRLRLEERGFRQGRKDELRARYLLQGEYPLGQSRYYLVGSEEILFNVGANAQQNALNQNRIYGGIGIKTGGDGAFGMGYIYTQIPAPPGSPGATTHTLRVFWATRHPFRH
ncbi:MAG: DUF2490 domain-containing protein [Bryobacterales bacterium]|nr:DUF2490 domain-containing protein [Acidobacteriota bacterium]MCB9385767.1 DUF2490 domain-containing protein [Bryobacterales bacterium]